MKVLRIIVIAAIACAVLPFGLSSEERPAVESDRPLSEQECAAVKGNLSATKAKVECAQKCADYVVDTKAKETVRTVRDCCTRLSGERMTEAECREVKTRSCRDLAANERGVVTYKLSDGAEKKIPLCAKNTGDAPQETWLKEAHGSLSDYADAYKDRQEALGVLRSGLSPGAPLDASMRDALGRLGFDTSAKQDDFLRGFQTDREASLKLLSGIAENDLSAVWEAGTKLDYEGAALAELAGRAVQLQPPALGEDPGIARDSTNVDQNGFTTLDCPEGKCGSTFTPAPEESATLQEVALRPEGPMAYGVGGSSLENCRQVGAKICMTSYQNVNECLRVQQAGLVCGIYLNAFCERGTSCPGGRILSGTSAQYGEPAPADPVGHIQRQLESYRRAGVDLSKVVAEVDNVDSFIEWGFGGSMKSVYDYLHAQDVGILAKNEVGGLLAHPGVTGWNIEAGNAFSNPAAADAARKSAGKDGMAVYFVGGGHSASSANMVRNISQALQSDSLPPNMGLSVGPAREFAGVLGTGWRGGAGTNWTAASAPLQIPGSAFGSITGSEPGGVLASAFGGGNSPLGSLLGGELSSFPGLGSMGGFSGLGSLFSGLFGGGSGGAKGGGGQGGGGVGGAGVSDAGSSAITPQPIPGGSAIPPILSNQGPSPVAVLVAQRKSIRRGETTSVVWSSVGMNPAAPCQLAVTGAAGSHTAAGNEGTIPLKAGTASGKVEIKLTCTSRAGGAPVVTMETVSIE